MFNSDLVINLILGLVGVLAVIGMATTILYCLWYGYSVIDGWCWFDNIKYNFLRVFLNWLIVIAVYVAIIVVCCMAGGYALSMIKQLIG